MEITNSAYQFISREWDAPSSCLHKTMIAIAALVVFVATPILALIDVCRLPWAEERMVGQVSILDFYRGGQNDRGVTLEEIWSWDDAKLEDRHDFIQWLFPLKKPSQFNPSAALTNDTVIAAFKQDKSLQDKMLRSLNVMLKFYGLEWQGSEIVIGPHFASQAQWLTPGNHNYLRISRILTSLRLHGLDSYANAFKKVLGQVYQQHSNKISPQTFSFWK